MTYYLVPRMTRREMQKALDALKAPLRFPRAEGGVIPPTEPRDQEHDMTTLNDLRAADRHRQHMALLAIHDLLDERLPRRGIDLTPQEFTDFLAAAKGEPEHVPSEEPPVETAQDDVERLSVLAEKGERHEALRADVERLRDKRDREAGIRANSEDWRHLSRIVRDDLDGALDRDDKRGEQ